MVRETTLLDYILLGLLQVQPRSGYALRQILQQTAMGNFSGSPGAVYPALKRLQANRMIRVTKTGVRGATNHLSPQGKRVLLGWLRQPVTVSDVRKSMHLLLLRFSFMQDLPHEEIVHYLTAIESAVVEYIKELRSYLARSQASLTTVGAMAVQNGIDGYATHQRWAHRCITLLSEAR